VSVEEQLGITTDLYKAHINSMKWWRNFRKRYYENLKKKYAEVEQIILNGGIFKQKKRIIELLPCLRSGGGAMLRYNMRKEQSIAGVLPEILQTRKGEEEKSSPINIVTGQPQPGLMDRISGFWSGYWTDKITKRWIKMLEEQREAGTLQSTSIAPMVSISLVQNEALAILHDFIKWLQIYWRQEYLYPRSREMLIEASKTDLGNRISRVINVIDSFVEMAKDEDYENLMDKEGRNLASLATIISSQIQTMMMFGGGVQIPRELQAVVEALREGKPIYPGGRQMPTPTIDNVDFLRGLTRVEE